MNCDLCDGWRTEMLTDNKIAVTFVVYDNSKCDVYYSACSNQQSPLELGNWLNKSMLLTIDQKRKFPDSDLKTLFRILCENETNNASNIFISFYPNTSTSYPIEIVEKVKYVYVCDFRMPPSLSFSEKILLDEKILHDKPIITIKDLINHIYEEIENNENKNCDIINYINKFESVAYGWVKDNRGIIVCGKDINTKEYFIKKSKEHAKQNPYHKTYVFWHEDNKESIIHEDIFPELNVNKFSIQINGDEFKDVVLFANKLTHITKKLEELYIIEFPVNGTTLSFYENLIDTKQYSILIKSDNYCKEENDYKVKERQIILPVNSLAFDSANIDTTGIKITFSRHL